MNTRKQDGCLGHSPLIGGFLITRNLVSACECDITLQLPHIIYTKKSMKIPIIRGYGKAF